MGSCSWPGVRIVYSSVDTEFVCDVGMYAGATASCFTGLDPR